MAIDGGADDRVRFGGLASGLDTAALVETLLAVERRPLVRLEQRRDDFSNQQSLLRDLNTRVLALRDAARKIDNHTSTLGTSSVDEEFLAFELASSDPSIVTGQATGEANPGSYDVKVEALATVGRRISAAFASNTTKEINAGERLEIDYGGDDNLVVDIGATGASLLELRDAINVDTDNGGNVRAEVLFDGSTYQLVISGTQTGVDNDINVITEPAHTGGGPFIVTTQNATDAALEVFGIDIARASNTIDDVIPGVTLQLQSADPDTTVTVDINLDNDAVAADIEALVDAYNEVVDFIDAQTAFNTETLVSGPLAGDSTLSLIQRRMQSAVGAAYGFVNNDLRSSAEIGVSFGQDGRLELDREKLDSALNTDSFHVREFLAGANTADFDGTPILYPVGHPDAGEPVPGDGLATALARALEPITRTGDGFLQVRVDGIDDRISDIEDRIERFEDILDQREERLIARFAALERVVAAFQAQSSFLGEFTR